MKRLLALSCAVLLLSGCAVIAPQPVPTGPKLTDAMTTPSAEPTEEATQPIQTEPLQTEPADPDSYTLRLSAAVSIFEGPGYDERYLRVVGEDGVYTIVEEVADAEGNLWGKLKSGVGWIDLTALEAAADAPFTAAFADEMLLNSGNYIEYVGEESEYASVLAIRANETLKGVAFAMLEPDMEDMEGYVHYETLYTVSELTPDTPLVARVMFYGDMTAYGITFTTADETTYFYALTVSGRNGALVAAEYTP